MIFVRVLRPFMFVLALLLTVGAAQAKDSPKAVLETAITKALKVLQEPGYANDATRPPLRAKIEQIVAEVFDFNEFSARTVGSRWPSFSDDQKTRFAAAFARLLLSTYLERVTGYNGEKIDYTSELLSDKGDRAEVPTIVTMGDGKRVPVAYRMMLKNGRWVVYDVLIENVSLIKNYRSQFNELLARGTADQLIAKVLERANSYK